MEKKGAPHPGVAKVSDSELARIPEQLTEFSVKVFYIEVLLLLYRGISNKDVKQA